MQKTSSILATLLLVLPLSSSLSAATFEVLFPVDYAYGEKSVLVSDDGSTVLSTRAGAGQHNMYLWTESQGVVQTYPRAGGSDPSAISGDGQTIVTYTYPSLLGIYDASYDGSTQVGASGGYPNGEAIAITPSQTYNIGKLLPTDTSSLAWSVSGDGKTVVGVSTGATTREAFYWTADSGMVAMGTLPGATVRNSYAHAISPAGDVIVGRSASQNSSEEAFRWTPGGGMQPLGDLPGGFYASEAFAVANGGDLIVGKSFSNFASEAFLWDTSHGMRRLADVLIGEHGLDLQGLKLISATDISASGNVIVGWATDSANNAFAFRVNLIPEPSTLILLTAATTLVPLTRRRS